MCLGILYWLCGSDLCLCIFLGRPSLELIQEGFGRWLTDVGLTLIGSLRVAAISSAVGASLKVGGKG